MWSQRAQDGCCSGAEVVSPPALIRTGLQLVVTVVLVSACNVREQSKPPKVGHACYTAQC